MYILTDGQSGHHESTAVEQGGRFGGNVSAEIRQQLFFFFGEQTRFGLVFFAHFPWCTLLWRRGRKKSTTKRNTADSGTPRTAPQSVQNATPYELQLCLRITRIGHTNRAQRVRSFAVRPRRAIRNISFVSPPTAYHTMTDVRRRFLDHAFSRNAGTFFLFSRNIRRFNAT